MPHLSLEGRLLFYERGGGRGRPVLLLSGSLGTTLEMWEPQIEELQKYYDVIRYDMRGHGRSSTPSGPYSIDQLGGDVIALVESLGVARVAFCGLSIGGAIGQWLAIHVSQYFHAFILANTAARIGTPEMWEKRICTVKEHGMAAISKGIIDRWFTGSFHKDSPQIVERMRRMLNGCNSDGYVSACAALRDMDFRTLISNIHTPTCIVAGEHDLVTTIADARFLLENIAGSSMEQVSAAHISNVEAPLVFNAAVLHFLEGQKFHG